MEKRLPFFTTNCRALIIGSSGTIGSALVELISGIIGPERVIGISRSKDGLDFFDSRAIEIASNKQQGFFRLIIDATGVLELEGIGPEKSLKSLEYENMVNLFKINAIGPAVLIKHFQKFLPREGKAVFATLSAKVGSTADNRLGGWISYRASKAALNQIVKTASIELARKHPELICVAIHPGTVRTKLSEKYITNYKHVLPAEAASNIIKVLSDLNPSDTGGFYDYLGRAMPW